MSNSIDIKIYYKKQLDYNTYIINKCWHLAIYIYIYLTVSTSGNASCKRAILKNGASAEILQQVLTRRLF